MDPAWLLPLVYAGLCAMVFVPLESLAPLRNAQRSRWTTDVLFATVGALMVHGLLALAAGLVLAGTATLPPGPLADAPVWVSLPVGLLAFELTGYGYHRAAHALPGLSALHDVHHSAEHMDWLAGFRQHPVEVLLMTLAQNLPLVLLGVPLGTHGLVAIAMRLNTQFVHANLRTPAWLAPFVATPTFHHRHHQRTGPVANYATLFPWLDRLFGTWSGQEATQVGLPGSPRRGFIGWLVHPFQAPQRPSPTIEPTAPQP